MTTQIRKCVSHKFRLNVCKIDICSVSGITEWIQFCTHIQTVVTLEIVHSDQRFVFFAAFVVCFHPLLFSFSTKKKKKLNYQFGLAWIFISPLNKNEKKKNCKRREKKKPKKP